MRIAFIIWDYWPDRQGGSERQCRLMAGLLAARGHACEVLAARNRRGSAAEERDGAIRVRRLGSRAWWLRAAQRQVARATEPLRRLCHRRGWDGAIRLLDALGFWICLPVVRAARRSYVEDLDAQFARDHAFDVIHLHEPSWLSGPAALLGARWRIPVLAQEATRRALLPLPRDVPRRSLYDAARRRTSFIAMTDYLRQDLEKAGIPADRIHDLPNGVVIPEAAAAGGRGVLYVGNFSQGARWKAFDVLFAAWARVARSAPAARLVLLGGGEASVWQAAAAAGGFADTLTFAGETDRPEDFYRAADLFVLPSRVEGLSNALLEAQSWGLPCIVSDIPGNRAVVEHEVNGLVVPVGEVEALASALQRLLADAPLRRRLGEAARRLARERYDANRVAAGLEAIYRQRPPAGEAGR